MALEASALGAGLVALLGWPRLGLTNLAYGFLARVLVVIVTWLALRNAWDVHYVQLPPNVPADLTADERLLVLGSAQLTFWIGATMLAGGFAGALAASLVRKR